MISRHDPNLDLTRPKPKRGPQDKLNDCWEPIFWILIGSMLAWTLQVLVFIVSATVAEFAGSGYWTVLFENLALAAYIWTFVIGFGMVLYVAIKEFRKDK